MRAIFQTVKSPTQLKPVALLTAMTLALTACGTDSKPTIHSQTNPQPINTIIPTFIAVNFATPDKLNENGELNFLVTLKDVSRVFDKNEQSYEVNYTLTGDNLDAVLADPSQKTGKITLNKNTPSINVKIKLKADGIATADKNIGFTLSNPSTGATIDPVSGTANAVVKNSDSGVQIADTTVTKGSGESVVALVVSVAPNALDKDTKVFFDLVQGSAKENVHYKQPAEKFVVIKKGEKEATVNLTLIGEAPTTPLEFSVKLLNTDNGIPLFDGKNIANVRIDSYVAEKAKLGALNDTGVTVAGNPSVGTLADCSGTSQDCHVGRDKTHNDDTDGKAGFSFTKLDKFGKRLANDATTWACVKDNVTGLIWETKTYTPKIDGKWGEEANANKDFRDAEWQYTYYDGKRGLGIKDTGKDVGRDKDTCGNEQHICSTEHYAVTLNSQNLCGVKNWRLPTRTEVLGVMNLSSKKPEVVLHKGWLFPNEMNDSKYPNIWTSSPVASKARGEASFKFGTHVWSAWYDGTFSAETLSGSYDYKGVILVSNGQ